MSSSSCAKTCGWPCSKSRWTASAPITRCVPAPSACCLAAGRGGTERLWEGNPHQGRLQLPGHGAWPRWEAGPRGSRDGARGRFQFLRASRMGPQGRGETSWLASPRRDAPVSAWSTGSLGRPRRAQPHWLRLQLLTTTLGAGAGAPLTQEVTQPEEQDQRTPG